MIEKMTRYDFILLSENKEAFISRLGELGVMDITRSAKPVDGTSEALLQEINALRDDIQRITKGRDAHLKALQAEKTDLDKEAESLSHWGDFDREKLLSLGVPVRFFCVPEKSFDKSWEESFPLQVLDSSKGKIWFVVFGDGSLPVPSIPLPSRSVGEVQACIASKEAEIAAYTKELEDLKDTLPELREKEKDLSAELNLYLAKVGCEEAADNALVVYEGFAPSTEHERLAKVFDTLPCIWFSAEAVVEDNPPIKLKNNRFVKQFETLTDMYGRPDYNEFDPTPYISVFFLLFFAMCMGDAGYGLLLIIGGILLRKVESMKNLAPLVTILGVGTFLVGIVMHTFFGFLGSLSVWGWTLLIVGGVIVGAAAMFSLLPPEVTKWIIIVLGVVSALGIFLFNDIHRNPLKNIGSGLWETYNTVTGLLGDVLSYLRLYALGLAGGMLGKAFNDIAAMTLGDGSFGIGWFAFAIILIIGHALNLAMCCLGAFVHPLRLNFLEFFKNSGYDGKGRGYKPISN